MATVRKRPSDKARGAAGKWTCYYIGVDGKRHSKTGVTDKAESQRIANDLEKEATLIREGRLDPREKARHQASFRSVRDHLADYHAELKAREDTAKHVTRTVNALDRLLRDAAVTSVADLASDRIRSALGRMRSRESRPISARTGNFYIAALKAFASWLHDSNRILEVPRGVSKMDAYNEQEDRRHVRRALTMDEIERLCRAASEGSPIEAARGPRAQTLKQRGAPRMISGPDRALLYRLAMGTGFRAEELRTLTPERFSLEGDTPEVTVLACYAKNGKQAVQPITRELAAALRPLLEGKPPGRPVLTVPARTAKMLRVDLAAAGIPYRDPDGRVADFHALRGSYITGLIMRGLNPRIVQTLARHSTVTLTLEKYTHIGRGDLRAALEGDGDGSGG